MLLFVCSLIFCTSTSTYMSYYPFVCQTLLAFFFRPRSWVWPSGWQAASARAPDSLPVSKPRARFRSSRSSRGLVPPASNKLATAPHRVPPLRSPLPAPALSLNAERKLGRSPSEQGLARNICTRDLYWKKSSRGSFASKPRKRGTLENLYFPIRRLPTSSPASYVPISTNQPACPTSFPTQPKLPCQPEQPVCSCLLPIFVSQLNCLVCLQFVVLPVIQRTPYTS